MKIKADWHIHSRNSCDSASLPVEEMIRGAENAGILEFGITDHLHTPFNMPDLEASRKEYEASSPAAHFHFGAEASCVSRWEVDEILSGRYKTSLYEGNSWDPPRTGIRRGGSPGCELSLGLTWEDIRRLRIEYVVGGAHWGIFVEKERRALINDFHRQQMFLACHDMVDIVAHPWFYGGSAEHWLDEKTGCKTGPWFDSFGKLIPASMHDEFAAAAVEHGTLIEINMPMLLSPKHSGRFINEYLDYLAGLKEAGAGLCAGSDCHRDKYEIDFAKASLMLEKAGISEKDLQAPVTRSF